MRKNFIICGLIGLGMELLWTGLTSIYCGDLSLTCKTSFWMFPIYGLASFVYPVCKYLKHQPWLLRGGLYALITFSIEYVTGSVLRIYGLCPWDYSHAPNNIHGLINLSYTPLWMIAGLFFEWSLNKVNTLFPSKAKTTSETKTKQTIFAK